MSDLIWSEANVLISVTVHLKQPISQPNLALKSASNSGSLNSGSLRLQHFEAAVHQSLIIRVLITIMLRTIGSSVGKNHRDILDRSVLAAKIPQQAAGTTRNLPPCAAVN